MHRNGVSLFKIMGLAAAAAVLMLATGSRTALAQDNEYALSYYSNAHTTGAPDATLRFVNDGNLGDASPGGDACAATYVFDNNEQLIECCSCKVTPNGLLTLSVNVNLTSNTLTGKIPTRGVVKVLSAAPTSGGVCDPTNVNDNHAIRGWLTHIQHAGTSWPQTEEELTDSSLGVGAEFLDLQEDCKVAIELGSGAGVCSCLDAGR